MLAVAATALALAEIPLTTTRVAAGLTRPVFATAAPGDTARLFVVEQGSAGSGRIKILDLATSTVLATPFLVIPGIPTGDERGLLGLAFPPDYFASGYFYVYLSDTTASQCVRRYSVSANPDEADPDSGRNVLVMPDPFSDHNGGWMGFGADGFLYVATGDGGGDSDPQGLGQDVDSLLGKILRLDPAGDDFPDDP